jgi:hypothetical protein
VAVTSQWQSASDEDWALALARAAVIRPLTDQAELTEGLVATASAELGISRSLVYRLVAKFRKHPQVSSLLPGKRGRKAAAHALSEAAEAVVRVAIASVYLQREKPEYRCWGQRRMSRSPSSGLRSPFLDLSTNLFETKGALGLRRTNTFVDSREQLVGFFHILSIKPLSKSRSVFRCQFFDRFLNFSQTTHLKISLPEAFASVSQSSRSLKIGNIPYISTKQ